MNDTITDLEAAYDRAKADVVDIQTQLAQRKPVGVVAHAEFAEYREWSGRAKGALRHKLAELSRAKTALKNARRELLSNSAASNPAVFSDFETPQGLIRASYATIKGLSADVELEPEEQALVDALHVWLQRNGVAS